MPELRVRICGIPLRPKAGSAAPISAARKRYAPFLTKAEPDLSLTRTLTAKKLRAYRDEPRVVWDERAGRVDRHVRLLQCALYFGDDSRGSRALLSAARRCVLRAPTFALGYDARTTTFGGVESLIRKALR